MTSVQFVTLIQAVERGTQPAVPSLEPRFVPRQSPARALGARWLRTHASISLRLARRLDPHEQGLAA